MNILDKINNFFSISTEKPSKKIIENLNDDEDVLLITQNNGFGDNFKIYDNNSNLKYTAKGKAVSFKAHLAIYSDNNKHIADIVQKKISINKYFTHDVILKKEDKKIAELKSKFNLFKYKYYLDNGWSIENKAFKSKYEVKNGNDIVAEIFLQNNSFLVRFKKEEDELLILLIALTIALYNIVHVKLDKKEERYSGGW